jgi:hypothetical protein
MTTCFVIGPIGNAFANHGSPERIAYESALDVYENVVAAACAELGIEAVRADQISISGDITDQIFRRLYESDLVIADLTGANANVMYELGLRHSLDKLTIQVADASTALPFDVKSIRTILVKRTPHGLVVARNALIASIEAGLRGELGPVAATRIWEAAGRGAIDEVTQILNDAVSKSEEDDEEEGYLDIMFSLDDAFADVTDTTQKISESMTEMGQSANEFAPRFQKLAAEKAPNAARMTAVQQFAGVLLQHADGFSRHTSEFKAGILALDRKMKPLIRALAESRSLRTVEGSDSFMVKVEELAEAARGSLNGLASFGASVSQLGHLSTSLRRPTSLIATGVASMADGVSILDEWDFSIKQIRAHADQD